MCESDVVDNAAHGGFWMPLLDWNRYRHDTYKDNRDAELPFIRTVAAAADAQSAAAPAAADTKALIYSEYDTMNLRKPPTIERVSSPEKTSMASSSSAGSSARNSGARPSFDA